MFVTIPEKYAENAVLFAAVLKTMSPDEWTAQKMRNILRKRDFDDSFTERAKKFNGKTEKEIAAAINCKFIIRSKNLSFFGSGDQILLKYNQKKKLLHFDINNFFYLPKSVSDKSPEHQKLLDTLNNEPNLLEPSPKRIRIAQDLSQIEINFEVNIEVWERKESFSCKARNYDIIFNGSFRFEKTLKFHFDVWRNRFFLIHDEKQYFSQHRVCRNRQDGCFYRFETKVKKFQHEKSCNNDIKVNIIQKNYGPYEKVLEKAINLGYLGVLPMTRDFIFYDCESVLKKTSESFSKTSILSTHELVSISANAFQNGKHFQRTFVVKDSSRDAQVEIIEHFLLFCHQTAANMKQDQDVLRFLKQIDERLKSMNGGEFDLDELRELKLYLTEFTQLNIFGYNSQGYDLPIIIEHLMQACVNLKLPIRNGHVKILKKGLKYFLLQIGNCKFKDVLNFTSPMSLDSYLRTWHPEGARKLAYPYEAYENIEQIRAQKNFPPISSFWSTLKGPLDQELYDSCKKIFDYHIGLPDDHSEKWFSMVDYLKYYNSSDVFPASVALINQMATFEHEFGLSPLQSYSLASYAKNCMFKMYRKSSADIFTFPKCSAATELFRTQLIAGLTNCYKRHVTTDSKDESAAYRAKFSLSGKLSSIIYVELSFVIL